MWKWLFALIILMNVVIFLWPAGDKSPFFESAPDARPVAVNPESLELLPERVADTDAVPEEPVVLAPGVIDDSDQSVVPISQPSFSKPSGEQLAVVDVQPAQPTPAAKPTPEVAPEPVAKPEPEPKPKPKAKPKPKPKPKAKPKAKPKPKPAPKPQPVPDNTTSLAPAIAGVCARVGPFATQAQGRQAADVIKRFGVPFYQRAVAPRDVRTWRVFAGPFTNPEQVAGFVRALDTAGHRDRYVTNEADGSQIVSLGVFSAQSSALGLRAQMSQIVGAVGVRPEIRTLQSTHWIEVGAPGVSDANMSALMALKWPSSRVRTRVIPCKSG